MFNQSYEVHITPQHITTSLGINNLGSGHNTHTHAQANRKTNFKKPGVAAGLCLFQNGNIARVNKHSQYA